MAKELTFNEAIALVGEINKTLFWSASYVQPGRIEAVYHDPVEGIASSPFVIASAEEWAIYKAVIGQSQSDLAIIRDLRQQLAQVKQQLEQATLQQQKLQAALESSLAFQQEEEEQLASARALLEQAEMLISSEDCDFSSWLTAYAAFAEKYPQDTSK